MIYIDIHRSRENRISHSVLRRMVQREFREVTYEKKKKTNLELDIIHYLTQIGNYFFFLVWFVCKIARTFGLEMLTKDSCDQHTIPS